MMDLFISALAAIQAAWAVIEPLMWLGGSIVAGFWYVRRKLAVRRLRSRLAKDDEKKVIVVQVGRDIESAVAAHAGQVDYVISWPGVLADVADYRKVVGDLKKVLGRVNGGSVHLYLAGPLALAFMLGQEMGKYRSRVYFYQFTGGRYVGIDTWEV